MKTKFKKGDKVIMHSCHEVRFYGNKTWTCKTDSFIDKSGDEVVFFKKIFRRIYMQVFKNKINYKNETNN